MVKAGRFMLWFVFTVAAAGDGQGSDGPGTGLGLGRGGSNSPSHVEAVNVLTFEVAPPGLIILRPRQDQLAAIDVIAPASRTDLQQSRVDFDPGFE